MAFTLFSLQKSTGSYQRSAFQRPIAQRPHAGWTTSLITKCVSLFTAHEQSHIVVLQPLISFLLLPLSSENTAYCWGTWWPVKLLKAKSLMQWTPWWRRWVNNGGSRSWWWHQGVSAERNHFLGQLQMLLLVPHVAASMSWDVALSSCIYWTWPILPLWRIPREDWQLFWMFSSCE